MLVLATRSLTSLNELLILPIDHPTGCSQLVAPTSFVESGFFMAKITFLVDGFNLYHALDFTMADRDSHRYRKYKWLNLWAFSKLFVGPLDTLNEVVLFTAFATWDMGKVARHKLFVKANESVGVSVVYGEFKRKDKRCRLCHKQFQTFEEKQTDVNIALELFRRAYLDKYDRAVIISGDTDLIPAIKAVRSTFPQKQIGVIIPIGKSSEDLIKHADFKFKMREHHLQSSRFPDTLRLPGGSTLECPLNWR
jgi:uncharacterized LabA/DUF88 family protein